MRFSACFVLLLGCFASQLANAKDDIVANKNAIEAAFLYNFALFTDWPANIGNEFKICVMGSNDILTALEQIKSKQLKERPISLLNISSASQANTCQMLFIGRSEHPYMDTIAKQVGNEPVLTVSEENGYDPNNVIISLVMQNNRIAFNINNSSAREKSLVISSKLLKLALQVY